MCAQMEIESRGCFVGQAANAPATGRCMRLHALYRRIHLIQGPRLYDIDRLLKMRLQALTCGRLRFRIRKIDQGTQEKGYRPCGVAPQSTSVVVTVCTVGVAMGDLFR